MSPLDRPFTLARVETFVFRVPIDTPVVAAFGTFSERVAVLVRVEDRDGAHGWGEIWSNFPSFGATHRATTLHRAVAARAVGVTITDPTAFWRRLTAQTHVWAIQSGEPGPVASALAGLDCAVWDLAARRAGLPLCRMLGGDLRPVPVYASGLNPGDGPEMAARARAAGYRAFKQKIGFAEAGDLANLRKLRAAMRPGERLMVDVNQGWSVDDARRMAPGLAPFDLDWVEEPVAADTPIDVWRDIAALCGAELAGGENLRGDDLDVAVAGDWLRVIQPDIGKWGGVSGCVEVGRAAVAAGKRYCPHWLSGGVGLMHSAHALLAVGGGGTLEVDANDNPLRSALIRPFPELVDGAFTLPPARGIGVEPDLDGAARWLVERRETRAP
ncbi:MAG: mandelate racemase/muconate lactonizing enzyme family protein [Rhodospirillales bacterium]|nr:MAG: mandelate racemase/muconate lactonizing enzyme family protein [Rhodospirillales bacterium]